MVQDSLGTYNMHNEPVQYLDRVSHWLIATRSVVFVMTTKAAIVGGLYVLSAGFSLGFLLPLSRVVAGLVLGHATSNLLQRLLGMRSMESILARLLPSRIHAPPIALRHNVANEIILAGTCPDCWNGRDSNLSNRIEGPLVLGFALLGLDFLTIYARGPVPLKRVGLGEPTVFVVGDH